ncbi:MAG: 5-(carboxyamino)imidazole ribonucleotide synthase [Armatimonadetes bacterium]|nr:5-(carboxyamino)imidazole ribonucleotide synthase [Armatimonadota bacterium]
MKVGVLGGGQLGRMLALGGIPLGMEFRFLDPNAGAGAGQTGNLVVGAYDGTGALERFAEGLDVATFEFENVPDSSAAFLQERLPVFPSPEALRVSQDRLREKTFFRSLGADVPLFAGVTSAEELVEAEKDLGLPFVLKTRRFGYDGKGQSVLRSSEDVKRACSRPLEGPMIAEAHVRFDRELSVVAVRSRSGETAVYPLIENHHRAGILRLSIAPAPDISQALQRQAEKLALMTLEALDYVGVLAIELFQQGNRRLVNEMAPRVHNSGHWTIEGAVCSQFENHVRAICGLALGSTHAHMSSAMVNIVGHLPDVEALLRLPGAHVHLYGKAPRPGRKIGHITVLAPDHASLVEKIAQVQALLPQGHASS